MVISFLSPVWLSSATSTRSVFSWKRATALAFLVLAAVVLLSTSASILPTLTLSPARCPILWAPLVASAAGPSMSLTTSVCLVPVTASLPPSRNSTLMHEKLSTIRGVIVDGSKESPIKHIRLDRARHSEEDGEILQKIVDRAAELGVALTQSRYIEEEEMQLPVPSIRVVVSAGHTKDEVANAGSTIAKAFAEVHQI
eukprot:Colp12_sorted_trinity150504_noHs@12098